MKTLHALVAAAALAWGGVAGAQTLLNVSYDVSREFYKDINAAFVADQARKNPGRVVKVDQSHAGSSAQARAVADGLEADVVTMNTTTDIEFLAEKGVVAKDWAKRFPNDASPTTSTMLFLVRQGNPKGIKDWDDLVKPGISVVTPNPKTSGGARWNYLAAWGYALKKFGNNAARAEAFVADLFRNVPVLDSGARGSLTTFAERGVGDVFLSWENEAFLAVKELGPTRFDIVVPSLSILAEPPVTVVDRNVDRKGTRAVAQAYLEFLYTPQGQAIAADNYYRPREAAVAARFASTFTNKVNLFTIDEVFGGWSKAQPAHFNDGGVFDRIFTKR